MTDTGLQGKTQQRDEPAGPGTLLRSTRVERGMAVADVAAALHIPVTVIEKLEADDYQGLPPATFTRGYLRAYARLLELDPDTVLRRCPARGESTRPLRVSAPVKTSPDITPGLVRGFLAGAVLAVIVGGGYWFYAGFDPASDGEHLAEGSEPETPVAEPTVQPSDTPRTPEVSGSVDPDPVLDQADEPDPERYFSDALAGPAEGPSVAAAEPRDRDEPATSQSTPATPEEIPALELPLETDTHLAATGGDGQTEDASAAPGDEDSLPPELHEEVAPADVAGHELRLEFSGPSWVEVYDADGERLMYGLVERRGSERVRGSAPFSVVIGDANHVALVYEGEPVDLGQVRPGRVVRTRIPN
ncbi:MAG: helix-turn-helix domain-containing protein [Ectothiorhodospiraceae bacterium]|nr:helix-turn-helix domain-containing protein [Ectothiorhodospiraceae bacterium]